MKTDRGLKKEEENRMFCMVMGGGQGHDMVVQGREGTWVREYVQTKDDYFWSEWKLSSYRAT